MSLHPTHQFGELTIQPGDGALAPGTILQNRYEILETRNTGGFSIVYRARDRRFEKVARICAVKELYNSAPDTRLRDMTGQMFDREANMLASFSHPGIPNVFDYFGENNRLYLVMEFIDGQDLDELIEESPGPIEQDKVIDWAIQVLDVLSYLHNLPKPYVFRDVKPANIMLDQHGRIMLIDFNIAKVFQSGQRGTMIGTAGYPPPEQYRGIAEPQGDLYALGATMHHLLTNRDPRQEPPFTFHDHPVRSLNPKVSEELDTIVMKALEYEIDKRFETAEEFKQALEAQLGRSSSTAAPGASTVAFSTSALSFSQSGRVSPVWEFACEDQITSSPIVADGVLYVGCHDRNLYAIDAHEGKFIWKFPTDDRISSSPCVWRDRVMVGSHDHIMYAVSRDTGHILWSAPTRDKVSSSPCVAMEHVFFGSDDHVFYCLDVRNGREVWTFTTDGPVHSSPSASDELVFVGSDDTRVYALEIQTGKPKWMASALRPVISSPLFYERLVFYGSLDWNVYAVDAREGWAVWHRRTQSYVISSPRISESLGLLYFGSGDRGVYALEYSTGRVVWKQETGGPTACTPAVSDEAVYIGSTDGHLYSFDAKTGDLRWKFYAGAGIVAAPVIWENMVLVGCRDHKVYAFLL